jgi:hypothetical protein
MLVFYIPLVQRKDILIFSKNPVGPPCSTELTVYSMVLFMVNQGSTGVRSSTHIRNDLRIIDQKYGKILFSPHLRIQVIS